MPKFEQVPNNEPKENVEVNLDLTGAKDLAGRLLAEIKEADNDPATIQNSIRSFDEYVNAHSSDKGFLDSYNEQALVISEKLRRGHEPDVTKRSEEAVVEFSKLIRKVLKSKHLGF